MSVIILLRVAVPYKHFLLSLREKKAKDDKKMNTGVMSGEG